MTPWKITKPLSQTYNLFQGENLPYFVDGYRCSCGTSKIIIRGENDITSSICTECDNTFFYDAQSCIRQSFWYDYSFFDPKTIIEDNPYSEDNKYLKEKKDIKNLPFHFKNIIKKDTQTLSIQYGFDYVDSIDLINVSFGENFFVIYEFGIDLDSGILSDNYCLDVDETIQYQFRAKLWAHIQSNNLINLDLKESLRSIEQLVFFLQNKHLKEYQFFYWNDTSFLTKATTTIQQALDSFLIIGNEKSVKKELYINYEKQLTLHKRFSTLFIKPFLSLIEDRNIRANLLKIDFPHFEEEYYLIEEFVSFLLSHNYSQKQIYEFFNKINFDNDDEISLFEDTFQLFSDLLIDPTYFNKVRCTLNSIHDEFVRATSEVYFKEIYTQKLHYTKQERATCKKAREYQVKVPRDGYMLVEWSRLLQNCLSGYFHRILDKKTIVYGFFEKKQLLFAVEIREKMIIQASGKWNNHLNQEQKNALDFWYKNIYMPIYSEN